MRLQGKITKWDDDRGFGFISWHGDGNTVFFHIKAFLERSRRPEVGDIVTYEITSGDNGKDKAVKVRLAKQTRVARKPVRKTQTSSLPVVFTLVFMCALCASAYINRISWMVIGIYAVLSIVTFIAYGWDKSSARNGNWRTAESTLHLLGLMGGWPGAMAAQRLLRHKSSKQQFQFTFKVTVILNIVAAGYFAWSGDSNFMNQSLGSL
jgi:uncharacterized membrane protein YsdA (DUF1294 family)/cold shock CspA family protein